MMVASAAGDISSSRVQASRRPCSITRNSWIGAPCRSSSTPSVGVQCDFTSSKVGVPATEFVVTPATVTIVTIVTDVTVDLNLPKTFMLATRSTAVYAFAFVTIVTPSRPLRIYGNPLIRQFAEHLRRVHRLDASRRQLETAPIVHTNGVLDHPGSLGNEAVVSVKGIETASLGGRPDESALDFSGRQYLRILAEPAAENRCTARNRIIDHHPRHVRLRLDIEAHTHRVSTTQFTRHLCFHRRNGADNPVAAGKRLPQGNRGAALHRDPGLAAAVLKDGERRLRSRPVEIEAAAFGLLFPFENVLLRLQSRLHLSGNRFGLELRGVSFHRQNAPGVCHGSIPASMLLAPECAAHH